MAMQGLQDTLTAMKLDYCSAALEATAKGAPVAAAGARGTTLADGGVPLAKNPQRTARALELLRVRTLRGDLERAPAAQSTRTPQRGYYDFGPLSTTASRSTRSGPLFRTAFGPPGRAVPSGL